MSSDERMRRNGVGACPSDGEARGAEWVTNSGTERGGRSGKNLVSGETAPGVRGLAPMAPAPMAPDAMGPGAGAHGRSEPERAHSGGERRGAVRPNVGGAGTMGRGAMEGIRRCRSGGGCREYDAAGRLVAAYAGERLVARYEYDERGWQVRGWSEAHGWRSRLVTPGGRRLRLGDVYFDHDECGRIESRDDGEVVRRYVWSPGGRLVRVAGSDGVVREYDYDGQGRRVAKRRNGRLVERYVHDAEGRFVRVEAVETMEEE